MKTCPLCGKINDDKAKVCSYCGSELSDSPDPNKEDTEVVEVNSTEVDPQPKESGNDSFQEPIKPIESEGWSFADTAAILGMALGVETAGIAGLVFSIIGLKSKRLHGLAVAGIIVNSFIILFVIVYSVVFFSVLFPSLIH